MNLEMFNAMLLADFYKISHREQYPKGTELVYSTWTPRMSRMPDVKEVVTFGIQGVILDFVVEFFNENFFKRKRKQIVDDYVRTVKYTLGVEKPYTKHIKDLHKLGYLPIKIMALKEGTMCPIRVPMLTIENTLPEFFWLTNYLETVLSCYFWKPMTSATIALGYKKILSKYAEETVGDLEFVKFQGHDFSMRGMVGIESAVLSGAGHLTSFVGTDTIPAITWLEKNYLCNIEKELVGCSVPATEHSTMCTSILDLAEELKKGNRKDLIADFENA